MTEAHHTRAHAQWSASATSRNVVCTGAIALETLCEDRESEAAAWGSCAHELAEHCFTDLLEAISFLGTTAKIGKFEFVVDEEMVDCTQTYVDHVREESIGATWVRIEQRFSLAALNPPMEAGGTGDAILYFAERKHLKVKDLKGGRGVIVEVKGNAQMRTYALCALLAYPDIDVETIEITIIQPRAEHKDGRIRSETFHIVDLLDWTYDLLRAMRRSKDALDEFEALDNAGPDDRKFWFKVWAEKWLTTGQCTFCPAKAICPKIRAEALATAGKNAALWFEDVSADAAVVVPEPSLATPEQLGHWLDGFELLEGWVKAVRSHAHGLAERGTPIPGYQLVESIGNRKWEDDDATIRILRSLSLTREQIFAEKLKSPAQIEKILGAKRKSEIADLVVRPVTGTNLVAQAKTTRAPALSTPEKFFEQM